MIEAPSIQWFPGHMAKTKRLMRECMGLVDIVIELVDARIPFSSRNPEIDKLAKNKPRVMILNKSDSADERITAKWCSYYEKKNIKTLIADCRSGKGLKGFYPLVNEALKAELERRKAKGMIGKPIRMMIVGIPNVGKSSLINRLSGAKRTKVEDRPGVTRGKQWVSLETGYDLLDMPGVLWPKFEDQSVGEKLAFTGAIKDDILDTETLAMRLLEVLDKSYHAMLDERYKLGETEGLDGYDLLELVGKKRGMLMSGGVVNTERAAATVLDEFRSGKLGRITLESPDDIKSDRENAVNE